MKSFRLKAVITLTQMQAQAQARAKQEQAAAPKPQGPSRKQRRYNALFNRKLSERMKKDQLPATIEVLPDGGLHVTVDGRTEEKRAASVAGGEGSTDTEE